MSEAENVVYFIYHMLQSFVAPRETCFEALGLKRRLKHSVRGELRAFSGVLIRLHTIQLCCVLPGMAPSQLEKRTTVISTGRLPSNKLLELGVSRPFVHQAWSTTSSSLLLLMSRRVEVRSTSSFLSTTNSMQHSENSKLITVPRVLRCLRYTRLSMRAVKNLVFPGALSRTSVCRCD